MERISIQWPSSMMVTSVASSSQRGIPGNPNVTATLNTIATEMASAISVIIPGRRSRSSLIAPLMNGVPPYKNTAVPNTAGIHWDPGNCGAVNGSSCWSMWPHTSVGMVSSSEIRNLSRNIATL
jgi:hypothetical protein